MAYHPFRRIVGMTGTSLALQEVLYGFIMALIFVTAARIGALDYATREHLVVLIVGMNLTWGTIDGIVFYLLDVFEQRKLIRVMRNDDGLSDEERIDIILDGFDGTALDILDPEDEREVCRLILRKRIESEGEQQKDRRRMRSSALGCFLVTALTIPPIVLPIMLAEDVSLGLDVASCLASVILMVLGYKMGPLLGVNKWHLALLLTAVSWTITLVATFTGG